MAWWRLGVPLLAATAWIACGEEPNAPPLDEPDPDPPAVAPEVTTWLDQNAYPFEGSHLSGDAAELEFLRAIVGDARLVSLGENTHGTRDFFEMKARILRFLVEEMDFDAFAIEATWPEANRLDRYVRTGEGDPEVLLSGLYFWTWNTESVLEMIEWMRDHNAAGGDVGFYGVDMQFPGMALHTVLEYVDTVDPDRLAEFGDLVSCLNERANGPDGRFPSPRYADLSSSERAACGASLESARQLLLDRQVDYVASSGESPFSLALQSMRVAIQYHEANHTGQTRDESMAENTIWVTDQLGPESRVVLWAHNFHVSDVPGAQGSFLRPHFGDDMVIFGFTHLAGTFTGVRQVGTQFVGLTTMMLGGIRLQSYEWFLGAATSPRFILDLRDVDASVVGADWLAASRSSRFIGCCYDPDRPTAYWGETTLRTAFDVIIHYDQTGATTVLPFQYPTEF